MRNFFSELAELVRDGEACTVTIGGSEDEASEHRYRLPVSRAVLGGLAALASAALLTVAVTAFTPLRRALPLYGAAQMEHDARQNARRAAALQDSLDEQRRYLRHLQVLMTAPVDSAFVAEAQEATRREAPPTAGTPPSGARLPESLLVQGTSQVGGGSPFAPARLPEDASLQRRAAGLAEINPPPFPVPPPAEGFFTRGFDAQSGHYAVDIAAEVGTPVHALGAGYVVMAANTQQGGEAIAVQHAGGYLSIYKHNRRLLKRVGEHVDGRDVIAESGNSGEITTGPHLHVELWRDGLAQDPAAYFIEK